MYGFIANWTFTPDFIGKSQIMEDAGPTVNVTAAGHFCSNRRIQTNGT